MNIVRTATAGTLESNDVLVYVSPGDGRGVAVEVNSIVEKLYGAGIADMIRKLVLSLGVDNAKVVLEDRGALDFAIKARVETAVLRAGALSEMADPPVAFSGTTMPSQNMPGKDQ